MASARISCARGTGAARNRVTSSSPPGAIGAQTESPAGVAADAKSAVPTSSRQRGQTLRSDEMFMSVARLNGMLARGFHVVASPGADPYTRPLRKQTDDRPETRQSLPGLVVPTSPGLLASGSQGDVPAIDGGHSTAF